MQAPRCIRHTQVMPLQASQLPHLTGYTLDQGAPRSNCGSGLARECGVSVSSCITGTSPSRASPLPEVDRVQLPVAQCLAFLWELACLRCRHLGVSGTPS